MCQRVAQMTVRCVTSLHHLFLAGQKNVVRLFDHGLRSVPRADHQNIHVKDTSPGWKSHPDSDFVLEHCGLR
jgi:hypothetical protein